MREGNGQIALATEDMFIWGQVREALLDLYRSVVETPGVKHHILSHSTIAPAVVDPKLIEEMSAVLLPSTPPSGFSRR